MKTFWSLIFALVSTVALGQPWSGVVAPTRAVDWTSAGVVGGVPSATWANCATAACNTLFSGTVTGASINAALASAGAIATPSAPLVVRVPSGTFTITTANSGSNGCIQHTFSNVVLRGAGSGAGGTKLILQSTCSNGFGLGTNSSINFLGGSNQLGGFNNPTVATWSASGTNCANSYAMGSTCIVLNTATGLTAGAPGFGTALVLDQLDDTSSSFGFPTANDVIECATQGTFCSNLGGGGFYCQGCAGDGNRVELQVVTVTNIANNGNGTFTLTVSPGLIYPDIRAARSPNAYWVTGGQFHNAGIEDFTFDITGSATIAIKEKDGSNVWIVRNRFVNTSTAQVERYTLWFTTSAHVTVEQNYFYGFPGGTCSSFPTGNYQISTYEVSDALIQNNIGDNNIGLVIPDDPTSRSVIAYNFATNYRLGTAIQPHGGGENYLLYEGNDMPAYYGDVTHGSHMFATLFRNLIDGGENNNTSCAVAEAVAFLTNNRFNNGIGNVFGSLKNAYRDVATTNGFPSVYWNLGDIGNNSGTVMPPDPNVARTTMIWGNWDPITSAANGGTTTSTNDQPGIRWCGGTLASNCGGINEVPSAITTYANPVPVNHTLPASFYLTSKPSWFGSVPFPTIGPDIANGNATNNSTNPSGGHANKIPARVCYESLTNDPAYGTNNVKIFNPAVCYASAGPPPAPNPPTNLTVTVQ